ncbi:MAG: hypothetical protein WC360_02590 [Opitutales bacterium]|jgi:hypothetical protein
MPKVDLELVKMILQRNELDIRLVSQIIEDINSEVESALEEEKPPPVKKQFVFMVSDPNGALEGKDMVGWVLQIPEDDSPYAAEERLVRSAYEYNITPKGRRLPVKTIAEVCENVSGRITKEQGVWIKTKEPVYVLRTGGKVPLDEIKKKMRQINRDQAADDEESEL